MTVANTTTKLQYKGNGENRMFGITFPLLSATHLRIIVTDEDGTETEVLDSITYPTVDSGLDPLPATKKLTPARETVDTSTLTKGGNPMKNFAAPEINYLEIGGIPYKIVVAS
mgnify:CR=1 FL=1